MCPDRCVVPTRHASVPNRHAARPPAAHTAGQHMHRRSAMFLQRMKRLATTLALALITAAQAAPPGGDPIRPIRLLVGYAAGGSVDTIARAVAPALTQRLGQPVEVVNIAGASGSIAAVTVALAIPG